MRSEDNGISAETEVVRVHVPMAELVAAVSEAPVDRAVTRVLDLLQARGVEVSVDNQDRRGRIVPVAVLEQMAIDNALHVTGGRVQAAAALLGMGRATLYRKMSARAEADGDVVRGPGPCRGRSGAGSPGSVS